MEKENYIKIYLVSIGFCLLSYMGVFVDNFSICFDNLMYRQRNLTSFDIHFIYLRILTKSHNIEPIIKGS